MYALQKAVRKRIDDGLDWLTIKSLPASRDAIPWFWNGLTVVTQPGGTRKGCRLCKARSKARDGHCRRVSYLGMYENPHDMETNDGEAQVWRSGRNGRSD